MVTLYQLNRILFLLGFFLHSTIFSSQDNKDLLIKKHINELSGLWNFYSQFDFNSFLSDGEKAEDIFSFQNVARKGEKLKSLSLRAIETERNFYRKKTGLELNANYQENFAAAFVDPEDVVVFRRRAVLGLNWNILGNGFYQNRLKMKMLENDYKVIKAQSFKDNLTFFQQKNIENIIRNFNHMKLMVIEKRRELNEKQRETFEKLYALKQVSKEDQLKLMQHESDILGQQNLYGSYNKITNRFDSSNVRTATFPVLDLDFEKLMVLVQEQNPDSIAWYKSENLRIQHKYINDVHLNAYTRYNYYVTYTQGIPNRSFISAGLNLTMPIDFNAREKREMLAAKSELLSEQYAGNTQEVEFIMANHYYEYKYKLKQYGNLLAKRKYIEELLRTEEVKRQYSDLEFNPNTALLILDDYWANTIELLDLKQDMYKLLLDINMKLPNATIKDYTKSFVMQKDTSYSKALKAIYIWSKAFDENDILFLTEYCKLSEFTHILVSYKEDKDYLKKLKEFIAKNSRANIHLMVGQNKLLAGGLKDYISKIMDEFPMTGISGIHLDIEPHTFEDYKENKEKYLVQYTNALKEIRELCLTRGKELSVSIPLSYPESTLTDIYRDCDLVYLMAYENTKPDFIQNKISEELKAGRDKTVLALRTKDFETRDQMDDLFKKLNFKKCAYHDISTMIKMDKEIVEKIKSKQ